MPNPNVPIQLEKIRANLSRVANHIGEHSGIDARHDRLAHHEAGVVARGGPPEVGSQREDASGEDGERDHAVGMTTAPEASA